VLRQVVISFLVALLALPAAGRTRPHFGGTLRVEIEGDPWQRAGGVARRLVLDGLTSSSADGTPQAALATEWKSEDNDHRWQFRLRSGVHFHDGTPLTSVNVVASLTALCAAGCPWTAVHAVGSSVVFTSDSPLPNLPSLLAADDYSIALTITENGSTPAGNIGTGPFQLTGFASGVLTLAANDNCWRGRPFLDGIEIRVHRSIRDQWLDLSVGRADLVEVPAEQLRQAREQRLTIVASPPATLLALQVADSGVLGNPNLRAAIALAIDRSALSNVIFQRQGEVTASLLPAALTGYSFLFPTARDLNKAHELRGGLAPPPLAMAVEGDGAMQLAAQRIALSLHEAGFTVQVSQSARHTDLVLRQLPLAGSQPSAALASLLQAAGQATPAEAGDTASVFKVEHDVLARNTLIPLLYLPRAFAVSGRVRDLRLAADGVPDLAGVSLEDAP
jgi:MarR-like DNA-binding transcriptional regulator SgrR of sgrS sRNA